MAYTVIKVTAISWGLLFVASVAGRTQSLPTPAASIVPGTVVIAARPPVVRNMWKAFSVSFQIVNTGSVTARNVLVREVTLDSKQNSLLAVPWSLGDIAADTLNQSHPAYLNAGFSLAGLGIGEKHLATVKGTYERDSVTYSFALNATVLVPPPQVMEMAPLPPTAPPLPKGFPVTGPIEMLAALVQVAAEENKGLWTYTLFNDEKAVSDRFIHAFQVIMAAPFVVRETPEGWTVQTDNHSFVLWSAAGTSSPNLHDLAPGASLGGFQIHSASISSEGKVYSTHAWNHKTNTVDRLSFGTVLTPGRQHP